MNNIIKKIILFLGIFILIEGIVISYVIFGLDKETKIDEPMEKTEIKEQDDPKKETVIIPKKETEISLKESSDKKISVVIVGDDFDHVLNPDNTISKENKYIYSVSSNGNYNFKVYNKDGTIIEKEIQVESKEKKSSIMSNLNLKITKNTDSFVKEVELTIIVTGEDFDYVLNPDNTKSYKKTYTYKVYENKIYKFLAFDKNNNILEDSIKITNISNSSKTENEPKKEEPKEESKTEIKATKLSILNGNLLKTISGSCTYLLYLEKGKSYSFNHNIEPVNTTNKTISLSSSNSNVSINSNTITANSIGNTVVTINSNSNSNLNVKVRVIILPSSVFNANTYSKVKVLSTITKKDFNIKYNVPVDSSIYITQSMAITSKYIIFNQMKRDATKGRIRIVNKSTFKQEKQINLAKDYGHCNSSTYNPNSKLVMTARYGEEYKKKGLYCLKIDENNISNSKEVSCSFLKDYNVGRFVYDAKLDLYIFDFGEYTNIYDSDFNKIQQFHNKKLRKTNQGFLSYNGVFYMPNSTNYMDLYRIYDMKYLGTYKFDFHEIEDIEMWNESKNEIALLFYWTGTKKDQFGTTTKIKIYK